MSPAITPAPGSFCWYELATTDQAAAKKFYQSIFNWSADDQPMAPGEVYTIFRLNGLDVAAGYGLRADQRQQNVPAHWIAYMLVTDADKSTARAKQLGATVLMEPFNVMDKGRMSVISDPAGAIFCVWQPLTHNGVGTAGEHGTVGWLDLNTPDQAKGARFYSDLFGWKMVSGDSMKPAKPGDYYHIVNGRSFIGGVPPAEHQQPGPANWLLYFNVNDAAGTLKKVQSMGGRVLMPMMTMENVRRFAVVADPQGAVFAVVQSLGGHETSQKPKPEAVAVAKRAPKKPAPAKRAAARPAPKKKPKPAARKSARPKAKPKKAKTTARARKTAPPKRRMAAKKGRKKK